MAGRGRGKETSTSYQGKDIDTDESDDDEECDSEWVAYVEKPPTENELRLLTRRMFPSKVGGRPAWLIPKKLPSSEELKCKECSRPLRFLLQVYTSRESEKTSAFHRVLHVFVCTSCQPNHIRVFRAQLPRNNDFYSSEYPDAKKIAAAVKKAGDRDPVLDAICCSACGLPRASDEVDCCTECQRLLRVGDGLAMFQERELRSEEADLPEEDDNDEEAPEPAAQKNTEDEGDVIEVEEVYTEGTLKAAGKDRDLVGDADAAIANAKAKGASEAVLEKLDAYRTKVAENTESALDASEQKAFDDLSKENGEFDPAFSKFNKYAKENMGHVVRWAEKPLWFSSKNQLEASPPSCKRCGAERVFDCQLQPQLISILAGTRLAERLDYGIACFYCCSKHCDPADDGCAYVEEFAFVQPEPCDAFLPKG